MLEWRRYDIMIVAFAICHKLFPEAIPFDHKVIIGGIIGTAVCSRKLFHYGTYGAEDRIRGAE